MGGFSDTRLCAVAVWHFGSRISSEVLYCFPGVVRHLHLVPWSRFRLNVGSRSLDFGFGDLWFSRLLRGRVSDQIDCSCPLFLRGQTWSALAFHAFIVFLFLIFELLVCNVCFLLFADCIKFFAFCCLVCGRLWVLMQTAFWSWGCVVATPSDAQPACTWWSGLSWN